MMNTTITKPFRTAYILGLGLSLVSFIIYILTTNSGRGSDFFSGAFLVNYVIGVIYMIFLLVNKVQLEKPRPNIYYGCWVNALVLFTLSAFSLNKEMNVFSPFPFWLNVYALSTVGLFFIYPFINSLPAFLKSIVYTLTGASFVLSVYMALFLCPLIPITCISFWFLGISLHTFIPALWLWLIIDFMFRKSEKSKLKYLAWFGALIPLLILGYYLNRWTTLQTEIKDILAQKNLQTSHELPNDILLAQKLSSDPMTEEILVSPFKSQRFWGDGMGSLNWNGSGKFHDPLSTIAIGLFGDVDIDQNTVESLLNIRRDFRHSTRRRLWTGTSLSTTSISNNIKMFPEYRIAYHEKTFTIHNDEDKRERNTWFRTSTQEALYTFHLPEGSIVTSLSLWINGKEEKSRLSTSQKADSAYSKIVGVERRDPAIVHWQEGNRITVNVFPCTEKEDRTFKIGFTSPLLVENGKVWLENIWFEGPEFEGAREATQISISGNSGSASELPEQFEQNAKGDFIYKGDYVPYWKIGFEPVALTKNKFTFGGNSYSIKELQTVKTSSEIKKVYLDVTKEWTKEEYDLVISRLKDKEIYVWLPEKLKLNDANKQKAWEEIHSNQFSVPFLYDITNPENTVVITKTNHRSPILNDLKGSPFADKTTEYLVKASGKIKVINIGSETSPFWRSLHELRLIDYQRIHINSAIEQVNAGRFTIVPQDSAIISLTDSKICLVKEVSSDSAATSDAPDHLLRIFAYNDILRKIGKRYFEKEKYENELFREAEEGYVITPISSMIVLESKEDYERMGIKENVNTVGNASVLGGGAVPEPHEWLLIGLVAAFILRNLYLKYKNQVLFFGKK